VLLEAVKIQVKTRLESSLHNRVYIIPDKDNNPSQVEHPWNIDVKSGSKPKSRLPKNTHIIKVFDKEGVEGRLLILGKPGAGKTTMLLELAKELMQRTEQDLSEPVPILLSLSSWQNDQQHITDWIVAELNSDKYCKVRKDITKQWLEEGEIIPLFDGLDELAAPRQEQCVKKLNEFLQPGIWMYPLVVCSRIEEYQLYSTQLALNTSLELQPFSDEQIQEYLERTGNEQLGNSIKDDRELKQLAQTPFLLNIIVLSCQKLSLDKWQEFESSAERLNYLFAAYVEVMLGRKYKGKRPSDETTKHWLSWLASKLIEQNQTEFFIEKMQPTWLEDRRHERIYRLIVGLSGGLIGGLSGWLIVGMIVGLFVGLIFGMIVGLSGGLIGGLSGAIRTSEILQFNWKIFWRKGLIVGLSGGLIVGLMVGLIVGLIVGLSGGLFAGLIVGLMVGLIVGLIFSLSAGLIIGLREGFKSLEIETRTSPNQGIWKSLQNAVIVAVIVAVIGGVMGGVMGGVIGGVMGGVSEGLIFGLSFGLRVGLIFSLSFGLMVGLRNGGVACIQHFILRLILYRNGYIPWNYAQFLDYATDRLFLQRVGGGYRFMHDLLRQHFAQNYR
jgi:DNA polymerase III delta prime subunit/MFS family permease